ncbi:UDP-2,3-diacylglucosamine diphosphatase [Bacteroides sp. ET71]|uniref:UDP-2,3-diacylglucosamine diphosphatase n=1 Tax=Bacteroides sp. ET71 TaxID=2939421 RepID=UPI00201364E6|nr:UDP-2,3-diacylglucosamine diphosphatase [Bacteroides sp. ET71]MCL1617078.1 UDP-2,3-diacylglucosamine diphosphatase [Bacteroides sp. ET71]
MKNVYFLSDAHLGSLAIDHRRTQERRLVNFLDSIKHKASAVYLLGDMFDFWYEFKTVVPKGYTRFLGKLSELTDLGVEVHFFIGNHDIWCGDYLETECGVILHREPMTTEICGKEFYLAHGDGLGDRDTGFKLLRTLFHSHTMQRLFSALHPRWSVALGLQWAKHSRLKRIDGKDPDYMGEDKEPLVLYTKEYLKGHPGINFFIYGHRHIELDLMLSSTARIVILGDWINFFSYAVFDGEHLFLENYIEGETKL